MGNHTTPEYIDKVASLLLEEENRADAQLDPITKPKMLEIIENKLITQHAKSLCDNDQTGCEDMFKNNKQDLLAMMYKVLKRDYKQTFKHITFHMKPYLVNKGYELTLDKELIKNSVVFVEKLLALKSFADKLVKYAYDDNIEFQQCRDNSFQQFMNESTRTAFSIAS